MGTPFERIGIGTLRIMLGAVGIHEGSTIWSNGHSFDRMSQPFCRMDLFSACFEFFASLASWVILRLLFPQFLGYIYPPILNVNPMPILSVHPSTMIIKHLMLSLSFLPYYSLSFPLLLSFTFKLCILDSFGFFPSSFGLCKFISSLLLSCLSILSVKCFYWFLYIYQSSCFIYCFISSSILLAIIYCFLYCFLLVSFLFFMISIMLLFTCFVLVISSLCEQFPQGLLFDETLGLGLILHVLGQG